MKSTDLWTICRADRHLKFHAYKCNRPTKSVQALCEHIESTGDRSSRVSERVR